MLDLEQFFLASNTCLVNAETGKRIKSGDIAELHKAGFKVEKFEPGEHFTIKVWLSK